MEEDKDLEQAIITMLLTGYQEINKRQTEELQQLRLAVGGLTVITLACIVITFFVLMR